MARITHFRPYFSTPGGKLCYGTGEWITWNTDRTRRAARPSLSTTVSFNRYGIPVNDILCYPTESTGVTFRNPWPAAGCSWYSQLHRQSYPSIYPTASE